MKQNVSLHSGPANLKHNRRDFIAKNVDGERTKDNVILKDQPLEEAYREAFGPALEKYNKAQKRKDRQMTPEQYLQKITKGYEKVKNNKVQNVPKPLYEWVIQIGNIDTASIKNNPEKAAKAQAALVDVYHDIEKQTKGHIHIVGAYLHMDEGTPHLHLDFVPTARMDKGMEVKNSLDRAVRQMGFWSSNKKMNATRAWQDYERDRVVEIAKQHGIAAQWEKHEEPEKHLSPELYRKVAAIADRKARSMAEKARENTPDISEVKNGIPGALGYISADKAQNFVDLAVIEANVEAETARNLKAGCFEERKKLFDERVALHSQSKVLDQREKRVRELEKTVDVSSIQESIRKEEQQKAAAQLEEERLKAEQALGDKRIAEQALAALKASQKADRDAQKRKEREMYLSGRKTAQNEAKKTISELQSQLKREHRKRKKAIETALKARKRRKALRDSRNDLVNGCKIVNDRLRREYDIGYDFSNRKWLRYQRKQTKRHEQSKGKEL